MAVWAAGEAIVGGAPGRWSAIVTRGAGEALWAHDADIQQLSASTIKIAVLIAVFRAIDEGRLRLDETRVLQESDKVGGSGVLRELHAGLPLTLHDLAHLMIAISDNTASNMLIDAAGLDAVNAAARDLGATSTVLGRRFLGRAARPGEPENLTTVADLALLLRAILNNQAASQSSCAAMLGYLRGQEHRQRLARFLPPGLTFAGKTGTLPGLALDAGIFFAPAGPLIIVASATQLPAEYVADEPMGRLAQAAFEEWGEIAEEYNFSEGVRGKYAAEYAQGTKVEHKSQ
ncbi:MAG: serine hydrolase [Thermomicrobiales bacterium]